MVNSWFTWDGSVELCMGTTLAVSALANTTSAQNTPAIAVPLAVSSSDIPTDFLGDLDVVCQPPKSTNEW